MLRGIVYTVGLPGELVGKRAAGLDLVERAVLTGRAAGAAQMVMVAEELPPAGSRPRLPEDLRWALPSQAICILEESAPEDRWLLLPAWIVADLDCLRALTAQVDGPLPARLAPSPEVQDRPAASGLWLAAPHEAVALLRSLEDATLAGPLPALEVAVPVGAVCCAVRSRADLADAERRLLASQRSDTDGWVDRVFNRHISRAFSRLVLKTSITPNQVTWLHIGMGLLASALFALGSYGWGVLAAVLFQLSVALDCSDGEVARLKLQFSRWGGTLDVVGDNVVHAAVFVAIALAARRQFGAAKALALGGSAFAGIFLAFVVVGLLTVWQRNRWLAGKPAGFALAPVAANHALMGQGHAPAPPAWLDSLVNQITSRDFSVLVVGAALLGHLEWMLWLAAVGAHLFWIGFLCLQVWMFHHSPPEAPGAPS